MYVLKCRYIYTVSRKKSLWYSRHNFIKILADFRNFFTITIYWKFAIKQSLNIPQPLKRIATLPCEKLMSENYRVLCVAIVLLKLDERNRIGCSSLSPRAAIPKDSGPLGIVALGDSGPIPSSKFWVNPNQGLWLHRSWRPSPTRGHRRI